MDVEDGQRDADEEETQKAIAHFMSLLIQYSTQMMPGSQLLPNAQKLLVHFPSFQL